MARCRDLTELEKSVEFALVRETIERSLFNTFKECKRKKADVTVAFVLSVFFVSIDLIDKDWNLGSVLSTRFLGMLDPEDRVGSRFISRLKDFIAALCIIDRVELVMTAIELFNIFPAHESRQIVHVRNKSCISFSNVSKMLQAVYGTKNRYICDMEVNGHTTNLEEFVRASGIHTSSSVDDRSATIPIAAVVSFFARIHPNSLWPLIFFQSKLRSSFLNETFIERIRICESTGKKDHALFSILRLVDALSCGDDESAIAVLSKRFKNENTTEKSLNFLLVEDSVVQRKMIIKKLKLLGGHHTVTFEDRWHFKEVNSGEDAMKLLNHSNGSSKPFYDVIIVDENLLGDMKGHEIVKKLKSRKYYDTTLVVGCTMNLSKNAPIMYSAGADTVWGKPIPESSVLMGQLEGLLSNRKMNIQKKNEALGHPTNVPCNKCSVLTKSLVKLRSQTRHLPEI